MKKIKILDTTLRDGTQSPDISFSIRDKIEIAKALDDFGIDYIEFGWPASNKKELDSFLEISKIRLKKSKIVAFGSTRRMNIKANEDKNLNAIIKSKAPIACIFGKTWLQHVKRQLKAKKDENLKAIEESIRFLKRKGLKVFYDLEHFFDGFKDNREYALRCISSAREADCLIFCDTNGGTLPTEVRKIIGDVITFLKKENIKSETGCHFHNDSGCAVANSLIAVELGITQIHGTINGFGERTGNTDLCQLIPNLVLKKKFPIQVKLKKLTYLSNLVYTLANIKPSTHQPYVGKNAFSHKGGVHVDAISKGASYEHIKPELVGNKRNIILSDLSGKANVVEVLKKFNLKINKNHPNVTKILNKVEEMERKGYNIGSLPAEQFLLKEEFFGKRGKIFEIKTWKILSEQRNGEFSECIITGTVDGKNREVVAPVNGGPVDAAYSALKKMIATNYKEIKKVSLINYKVMIAEDKGAESSVRVYIEFKNGKEEFGTVGVSTNILEASLEAIEKGFRYFLLRNT